MNKRYFSLLLMTVTQKVNFCRDWSKNIRFSSISPGNKIVFPVMSLIVLCFFNTNSSLYPETVLSPLLLDTPRSTIKNFMKNMNLYREGVEQKDLEKIEKINLAVKCLNLKELPPILRNEEGREIAIYLKEVIDKIILFSETYDEVPADNTLPFWSIPETEITLQPEDQGGKKNFLFNPSTVVNAKEYFLKTKNLPYIPGSGYGAKYTPPWRERISPTWSIYMFLGLYLWQWFGIIVAIIISYFIKFSSRFLFKFALKIAEKTPQIWDDQILLALSKSGGSIFVIGFWFVFLYITGIEGKTYTIINYILKILLGFYFIIFLNDLSEILGNLYKYKMTGTENPANLQLVPFLTKTTKVGLISLGIMISLQNLGINVISLLAGLGIGGLAIALAARDTAANLFGSIMILLDKPFKIGDHIIIGAVEGEVVEIGFRSTQIRSLNDSIISIPNAVIANANIENNGERRFIRTNFSLFISYDTPPQDLEAFLEGINKILAKNPNLQKEDLSAVLSKLGDPGIEILVNFYSFPTHHDFTNELRQKIYMEILSLSSVLKISFVTQARLFTPLSKEPTEIELENLRSMSSSFGKDGLRSKPDGYGIFQALYKKL